jgi:hypothetical protein
MDERGYNRLISIDKGETTKTPIIAAHPQKSTTRKTEPKYK